MKSAQTRRGGTTHQNSILFQLRQLKLNAPRVFRNNAFHCTFSFNERQMPTHFLVSFPFIVVFEPKFIFLDPLGGGLQLLHALEPNGEQPHTTPSAIRGGAPGDCKSKKQNIESVKICVFDTFLFNEGQRLIDKGYTKNTKPQLTTHLS
jgi:hypothetical protein